MEPLKVVRTTEKLLYCYSVREFIKGEWPDGANVLVIEGNEPACAIITHGLIMEQEGWGVGYNAWYLDELAHLKSKYTQFTFYQVDNTHEYVGFKELFDALGYKRRGK